MRKEIPSKWRLNGKSRIGAPIYQKYFTFSYKGQAYDFVSNGRKTGFLSANNGNPTLQIEGSKIDLERKYRNDEPVNP